MLTVFAIGMGAAVASNSFLYHYIRSPAILPTVAAVLFLVLVGIGGEEMGGVEVQEECGGECGGE